MGSWTISRCAQTCELRKEGGNVRLVLCQDSVHESDGMYENALAPEEQVREKVEDIFFSSVCRASI